MFRAGEHPGRRDAGAAWQSARRAVMPLAGVVAAGLHALSQVSTMRFPPYLIYAIYAAGQPRWATQRATAEDGSSFGEHVECAVVATNVCQAHTTSRCDPYIRGSHVVGFAQKPVLWVPVCMWFQRTQCWEKPMQSHRKGELSQLIESSSHTSTYAGRYSAGTQQIGDRW